MIEKNKNIYLKKNTILSFLRKYDKKIKIKKKIPLKTQKYNARYKFDKLNSYILN